MVVLIFFDFYHIMAIKDDYYQIACTDWVTIWWCCFWSQRSSTSVMQSVNYSC